MSERKHTVRSLARESNVPHTTIQEWINRRNLKPWRTSWPNVVKIATALHLAESELNCLLKSATLPYPVEELEKWAQENRDISLIEVIQAWKKSVSPASLGSPYPGLQPFEKENAYFFFGREALTRELVKQLKAVVNIGVGETIRLIAIVGSSGVGKSSLIQAGLIPMLESGQAIEGSQEWSIITFHPGDNPMQNLAAAIGRTLGLEIIAPFRLLEETTFGEKILDTSIRMAWPDWSPEQMLVLIVDQFEEVFTQCQSQERRELFIDNLLYAARVKDGQTVIVLTLRADFWGICIDYPNLAKALAAHQVPVGQMTVEELHQAIVRPAESVGYEVEPQLVTQLLHEVQGQPGSLPLLQHTLLEVWRGREGKRLSYRAYQAVGGINKALEQWAEQVYHQLTEARQAICRQIFLMLVQPGDGTGDSKRRVLIKELYSASPNGQPHSDIEAVVEKLIEARLLRVGKDESEQEFVEVVHEALFRHWDRLQGWINENRETLLIYDRLARDAKEWKKHSRASDFLYQGTRLAQIQGVWSHNHHIVGELEQEFVAKSIKQHRRQKHLRVGGGVFIVTFAVVLIISLIIEQRQTEQERQIATANYLAAEAFLNLETWPQRSLLLSVDALSATQGSNFALAAEQALNQILAATGGIPLRLHTETVRAVAFSPDGQWLAAASDDGNVSLWQPSSLDHHFPITLSHQAPVLSLTFIPKAGQQADELWLATGDIMGAIRLWNITRQEDDPITLDRHNDSVAAISYSPNGKWLATGSLSEIRLWYLNDVYLDRDRAKPTLLSTPPIGFVGQLNNKFLAFSLDSRWLAVGHRLWDISDDMVEVDPTLLLPGYEFDNALQVAFGRGSPGSQRLATSHKDKILLWDLPAPSITVDLEPVASLEHGSEIQDVTFSPHNETGQQWLTSVGADGTIHVWNISEANEVTKHSLRGHKAAIREVAFSPDGHWLASASVDQTIRLWTVANLPDNDIPLILRGHENEVETIAFSPDSQRLATGSRDSTIRLWSVAAPLAGTDIWNERTDRIFATALDSEGRWFVNGGESGLAWLWDLTESRLSPTAVLEHQSSIQAVTFGRGGDGQPWLITGDQQGLVRFWSVTDSSSIPRAILDEPGGDILALAASSNPDKPWVAVGYEDGVIRLWKLDSILVSSNGVTDPPVTIDRPNTLVLPLAFSPDGQWLLTDNREGTNNGLNLISLQDVITDRSERNGLFPTSGSERINASTAIFSYNSDWLVAGGWSGQTWLWDLTNPIPDSKIDLQEHEDLVSAAAFSPDNRWLVTGSLDGISHLWDMNNLSSEAPIGLLEQEDRVTVIVFSHDSRWLAVGSRDGTIRLWDMTNPNPAAQPLILRGRGDIQAIAFSQNGKWLIATTDRNIIQRWPIRVDSELIELACRTAGRNLTMQEWRQFHPDQTYQPTCPN